MLYILSSPLRHVTPVVVDTDFMSMLQVAPRIFQLSLGAVNAFVIEDNGLTLIDTGYAGSLPKILAALQKAGKQPADIKQIILTHCHPDHAGSAAALQKQLGVPVYAHPTDARLLEQGIGGRLPFQRASGVINWLIYKLVVEKGNLAIEPVEVNEQLNEGDVLPIAGGLEVVHTPGHCAGHIALLVKNEGVLIAGDICANVLGLDLSPVYEDMALGLQSIAKASLRDFDTAAFGHGNPLRTSANKKLRKKFLDV